MKEEEAIKQIEDGLTLIKANPSKLRNFLSVIFGLLDRLKDIELVKDLKGKFMELQSQNDERSIIAKVDEIKELLINWKKKINQEKSFLVAKYGVKRVEYSKQYKLDLKTYAGNINSIEDARDKLLEAKNYVKNYHEVIKDHRKYEDYLHAKINKNLRLMYKVEKSILTFYEIITKNEFDNTR